MVISRLPTIPLSPCGCESVKKINARIFETISFGLVAGVVVLISTPVKGQLSPLIEVHNLNQREHFTRSPLDLLVQLPVPTAPTPTLPPTQVVPVTNVELVPTKTGIQIILTTPIQAKEEFLTVPAFGNESLIWLKNTRLQLPSGKEFHVQSPQPGIRDVYVTQQDDVTVQVRVVGDTVAPAASIVQQNGRLFVDVIPATSTAQQPTLQQGSRLNGENRSTAQQEQTNPQQKPNPSSGSNQEPIEIDVTAQPDTGYKVPDASIGTRTNTSTRDVPQTINVIPQQAIKDQHDIFIGDALKNAGVSTGGFPGRFVIRGFDASFGGTLTDGLRNFFTGAGSISTYTNNLDRIEVLRGPASVLYGQVGLSGIVNFVTKQPLRDPYYTASVSVGSFNSIQPTFDIGGPLTSDKKVLYRLDGSILSSDSFVNFLHQDIDQIAGSLSWQIEKNTKLTLSSSYENTNNSVSWPGVTAVGTLYPSPYGKIPRSQFLGQPQGQDPQDSAITRLAYKVEHRFSENWSVENAFQAVIFNQTNNPRTNPSALGSDNQTLTLRTFYEPKFVTDSYDSNTQVTGRFNTGSLKHQLQIGTEYAWNYIYNAFTNYSAPSINIFNPVYTPLTKPLNNVSGSRSSVEDLGVYAQDIITLFSNLKLVLGGRYDWAGQTGSITTEAFSPRAGLVYQPIKPILLYASYARSFVPQTGLSANGTLFPPLRGTQYEVGVKADLLGDKLSVNLALYQLTLTNNLTPDPNNTNFSIAVGEERSRGVELFVTGEILPGWNVIASYAYADPRVTKDNQMPVGSLLPEAPQNQASLWTTYIIPKGNLKGLGAGIGLFYVGDRLTQFSSNVKVPSYVRTDAALYYRRGRLDAALNFQNLFDLKYFDAAGSNLQLYYGNPFTVILTLGWHF